MKKYHSLIMPALLLAALCLPSFSQEENSELKEDTTTEAPAKPAAKPAAKKVPAKKKARKKKPAPPVSEYKFNSGESVPAYKFDKRANPIIKEKKKKKPAKKSATGKSGQGQPAAKLKTTKPIGEEEAPAETQQAQGQMGGE